jgi:hypothetical protein
MGRGREEMGDGKWDVGINQSLKKYIEMNDHK